ncbi:MBG domain-containing protein [Flavicella marina]|uniref:MBG domain-containing protein n=1 Tax=Flavicella marina TaxID=1475951 RepID=UPI00126472EC|nr:MBG domain-containing protein [Flavicella marina]
MAYPCLRSKWHLTILYFLVPLFVFSNGYNSYLESGFDSIKKNSISNSTYNKSVYPKWMKSAAFASSTPYLHAVEFDGVNDYLVANTNSDTNNPLRRSFMSTASAGSGKTANGGQPWATSIVFRHTTSGGEVGLWSQTAGVDHDHEGRLMLCVLNNRLTFYLGKHTPSWWRWIDRDYIVWTANTDLVSGKWYAVYVDYNGVRTDDLGKTPFRIRVVDISTGAVSIPTGTWDIDDGYTASVEGDFFVGARAANQSPNNGMIASVVATTLNQNTSLPSDAEIQLMTLDPLKWLDDYKVGNSWRVPNSGSTTSNFQIHPNDASLGAFGTKVWLMGDGIGDDDGNIENQVASDVASQDLLTRNMSSPIISLLPDITSSSAVSVPENIATTVYTADAVKISALSYSLGSGNDESLFSINSSTGEITFLTPPDFENPTDANNDNVYRVNFIVTNIFGDSENQNVDISVTNVAELVMTFDDVTKTYGDANFNLAATSNSGGGMTYSIVGVNTTGTSLSGIGNSEVSLGNVGTVTIRATVAANGSIEGGTKDMTLTIAKKNINVLATNSTKVYGDADPTFAFTSGFVNGDLPSDVFAGSLARTPGENVGSYPINIGSLALKSSGAGLNYTFGFTSADFTITAKDITITPLVGQSKVYGELDPIFSYDVSPNLVSGDVLSGSLQRVAGEDVGVYEITQGDINAGSNYTLTFITGNTFSITQKNITVSPTLNQSKNYGEVDPVLSYSVSPSLEVGDVFSGNLTRISGENVGMYEITQGDLSAGTNYNINFVSGVNFSIMTKDILITPVFGQSKIFGETDPVLGYTVFPFLEVGDAFSGSLTRQPGEDIGNYEIALGSLTAGANYNLTFASGIVFNIGVKNITITPNTNQSKIYGSVDPVLTYQATPSLEFGDDFTGSLSRVSGENIGNYTITQGSLNASSNYNIIFDTSVNFEIIPKEITITPNVGQSKIFGSIDPLLTFGVSPELETGDVFLGSLARVPGENIGEYAISQGSLTTSSNYTVIFNPGVSFEIAPKDITITPLVGQSKIYGEINPIYTYTHAPSLEIGDVFSGSLSRVAGENVGEYALTLGDLNAGTNYNLIFENGEKFNITPKNITVTPAAGQSKYFGEADPVLTYSYFPFLEIGDVFIGGLSRVPGESIGDYEVTQGNLDLGYNYNLIFTTGVQFKINPKTVTVTPRAGQTKVYGEIDPVLEFDVFPALESGDMFSGSLTRTTGENVGDYAIGLGSLSASANYDVVFDASVRFKITPKDVTITPMTNQSKIYGDSDPILNYTVSPALEIGDFLSGNLERTVGENIGQYPIGLGTLSANSNYTILFTSGRDFVISPKAINIVPTIGQTKVFGDIDPVFTYTSVPALILGDSFVGNLARVPGENVGTYEITQGDLTIGANYEVTFTEGILFDIAPKTIVVTPTAGQSKIFGEADPILSYTIFPFLSFGDAITGNLRRESGNNVGAYEIAIGDISASDNYTIVFTPGIDFNILPKKIVVTPVSGQSKEFGDDDPELLFNVFPTLEFGDVFSGSLMRLPGEVIGNYPIEKGTLSAGINYDLEVTPGIDFSITPGAPTITFSDIEKIYGDDDFSLNATSNSGGTISYAIVGASNGTVLSGVHNEVVSIGNAGTVVIRATVAATAEYKSASKDIVLTIHKAILWAKADNLTRVYRTENPTFTISYTGFVNGDTLADIDMKPIAKTIATIDSNVGEYYIVLYGGWDDNYIIDTGLSSLGILTIIQQTPVISFSNIVKTYGDPDFSLDATTNSVGQIQYSFVGNDNGNTLSGVNNKVVSIGNSGTVIVRATVVGTTNYESVTKDVSLTIHKATLTARAADITRPYGVENPELKINYEGFVYDDTEADLDEEPFAITIADIYSNVGKYYILLYGGSDNNYNIITGVLFPGILEVVQQTAEIDFSDVIKIYGDPDFTLNANTESDKQIEYSIVGEANGTMLSGVHNEIVSLGNAGTVVLRATVVATTNYKSSFVDALLTIEKAKVSIDIDSETKPYGADDPEFTYAVSSGVLKSGESLILTRDKGENVGVYTIYPSIANYNYDITYTDASLSISKAAVTIKAESQTKFYGDLDPVLSYSFVSGALASWDSLELSRELGEDVGTYPIYSTLDDSNYDVTFIGADLVIKKSIITIAADQQIKAYGEEDPILTYQITSGNFVEGDVFEGSLIREEGEELGVYGIYSTLENSNYQITYIASDLTITIAELTITIDDLVKNFGSLDPELTYKITSKNAIDTSSIDLILVREPGEAVGVYKISSSFSNSNYVVTIVDGLLQIVATVPIVVTSDAINITGSSADIAGKLLSEGGVSIYEKGFIISTSDNSLLKGDASIIQKIELNPVDVFIASEENLNSETTYYFRAYAENSEGVGYGKIKMIKTLDTTPPDAPTILRAADLTCPNNTEVTSDNQFVINGLAEAESVVQVFVNGASVGFSNADENGDWELDLSDVEQEDGTYDVTAIATDLSYNTSEVSSVYRIEIRTENSDLDRIPDFCDDDIENDGYLDATQTEEKIGYGISPNGDGINEYFVFRNIEDYPNNQLSIYSRSGALVYKANAYRNTWDGTNMFTSGKRKLPEGSYFFVLDLKIPGKKIVQGWIYIKY